MRLTKSITLNPAQSAKVSFSYAPPAAGNYSVVVNGLSGSFSCIAPPPVFDPWVYDIDDNGYLDISERLKATQDYYAKILTRNELDQVLALPSSPVSPTDYLSLNEDELYPYLVNGDVGRDWWNIPAPDRRALAMNILNWWSRTLARVSTIGLGEPNCIGGVYKTDSAKCHANACIRCVLYAEGVDCPDNYYYSDNGWHCLVETNFHLPVAYCTVGKVPLPIGGYASHAINGIQVGGDPFDFDSWIFFQYSEVDIKPGSMQMPILAIGNGVGAWELLQVGFYGLDYSHCKKEFIAGWTIDEEGVVTPLSVTGTLNIRVYGTYLGDPISGALVTCNGYSCMTDENGECRFDDLTSGDYTVIASKSGYITNSTTATVREGGITGRSIQLIKE